MLMQELLYILLGASFIYFQQALYSEYLWVLSLFVNLSLPFCVVASKLYVAILTLNHMHVPLQVGLLSAYVIKKLYFGR